MRATLVCLLLVPLLVAAPAPRIKPNLLKNGSFEEGPKINNYFSIRAGGTAQKKVPRTENEAAVHAALLEHVVEGGVSRTAMP